VKNELIVDINGFSLFELLTTLSIAFILLTLIIPSQKNYFNQSMSDVMKLQLFHAIHLAQSEAIASRKIVTLCQSENQTTCSGRWKQGYIILSDKKVIYSFVNVVNQGELYWRAFPVHQTQLDYLPSGMLKAENGTFWYCLPHENYPRWAIVINQSGRARIIDTGEVTNADWRC
jgi:Tfp pilus assembly protein FimT